MGKPPHFVGGWLEGLSRALRETGNVELAVITFVSGEEDRRAEADGILHYHLAIPPRHYEEELWFSPGAETRRKCREFFGDFAPEIVHIHGTEYSYGMLYVEGEISSPTVFSLQGLLGAYSRHFANGVFGRDFFASHSLKEILRRGGLWRQEQNLASRSRRVEQRIFRSDALFLGRTRYDRACLLAVNPRANYLTSEEVLRPPFYLQRRDPQDIMPHTVFSNWGDHPRKGLHCLLRAAAILKREYPDIQIRIPGAIEKTWRAPGYSRFIFRLIRSLHLEEHVVNLGPLNAEAMAREMAAAEIFAIPSFADNSPNALAEAMLIGVPCVASMAGGIPSMVRDGETALSFPPGDELVLAECIRMLFTDKTLAARLGERARSTALVRHDPQNIARTVLEAYETARRLYSQTHA